MVKREKKRERSSRWIEQDLTCLWTFHNDKCNYKLIKYEIAFFT